MIAAEVITRPPDAPSTHQFLCILDFEATCDDATKWRNQEVIEFPSVLISTSSMDRIGEFHCYVQPLANPVLTPFCTSLTGIQQAWVEGQSLPKGAQWASDFQRALHMHTEWLMHHTSAATEEELKEKVLFVTCGDWDLQQMLVKQCRLSVMEVPMHMRQWCNIKRIFAAVTGESPKVGMAGMLNFFRMELVGRHHSGIDDCRNIASLVERLVSLHCEFEVTADRFDQHRDKKKTAGISAEPAAAESQQRGGCSHRFICVLDFEATCDSPVQIEQPEIIEFPALLLDAVTWQRVSKFHYYIKPRINNVLTEFCKQLTGIKQSWVNGYDLPEESRWSDDFAVVLKHFSEWLQQHTSCDDPQREVLIVTVGNADLNEFLTKQCRCCGIPLDELPACFRQWCNLITLYHSHFKTTKRMGLKRMLQHQGIEPQGRQHSGIDDCGNTMLLVERMLNDGAYFRITSSLSDRCEDEHS